MVHDALISPFPRYRNLRSLKKDPFAMALQYLALKPEQIK